MPWLNYFYVLNSTVFTHAPFYISLIRREPAPYFCTTTAGCHRDGPAWLAQTRLPQQAENVPKHFRTSLPRQHRPELASSSTRRQRELLQQKPIRRMEQVGVGGEFPSWDLALKHAPSSSVQKLALRKPDFSRIWRSLRLEGIFSFYCGVQATHHSRNRPVRGGTRYSCVSTERLFFGDNCK